MDLANIFGEIHWMVLIIVNTILVQYGKYMDGYNIIFLRKTCFIYLAEKYENGEIMVHVQYVYNMFII